ncbi:putative CAP Gly-rich domain-containing protein [Lupinus albus]|uniref:Putative CAP Gly-rich domain-containing protein n=1 Tax=Lupinus albus TaxID=3870 RepID=A0A6A4R1Z1_LUPAL|nr:putative CAP Gly-rich domain-containing protein [Lupinus albus]
MASSLQKIEGDESVLLRVTHSNLKTFTADIRFSLQLTVEAVKDKLWKKCGTSVNSMHLELYDDARNKLADLSDNSKLLAFYSPLDEFRLHVVDLDPSSVTSGGWLEDTSLVEKYKISDEAYNKLEGTFRKYKEKLSSQIPSTVETKIPDTYMEDLCANIKAGSRCEVEPGAKRGVVKFVGRAEALGPGFWVGVQYDEPLGKHDGMVKGVRYFECPPSHGGMVRPEKVKVGDYPERDPFEDDEI